MTFQERAKAAIRQSGGRITTQRERLLDLLAQSDDEIDAETLHHLANQHDPNISLPTVYRTLHTLEEAQVVVSHYVSTDHERKVYRVQQNTDSCHFTCRRCGQVIAVQSNLIDRLRDELAGQLGVSVSSLCVCASGLCADCCQEEPTMTLDELKTGQPALVRRINGRGALRRRLMDMGMVKGTNIQMVRTAPMGDPVEYVLRGYHLSLRKSEAQLVEIELY